MTKVYVAGPLTSSGDVERNVRKAVIAGDMVVKAGMVPFIPHLCVMWNMITSMEYSYEHWVRWDLVWLRQCDVLLRLKGRSNGTERECIEARNQGIPIIYWDVNDPECTPEKLKEEVLSLLQKGKGSQ